MIDLQKVWPWALGVLLAVLIFLHVRSDAHHETLAQKIQADDVTVAKHWQAVADTANGKVKLDTVRLVQRLTHADTVLQNVIQESVREHHDTVTVTREILIAADSVVRSCRVTVSDCVAYGAAQKARGDALGAALANAKKAQPDFFQRHLAFTIDYGAVVSGGKVYAGPGVAIGWKLWPPNP